MRRHMGVWAAVLWTASMVAYAIPAVAGTGIDLTGGVRVDWPQLLFIGAAGMWAGRVNARLDAIEKNVEVKK